MLNLEVQNCPGNGVICLNMGIEVRYASFLETKRLLWLVASVFVMVLIIQYLGFPKIYVLPSLFSSSKGKVAFLGTFQSGESSGNSSVSGNLTTDSVLNTTASNVVHEATAKTDLSKTSDASVEDGNVTTIEDTEIEDKFLLQDLESNKFPLQAAHSSEFVVPPPNVTSENNIVLDKTDKDDITRGVAKNETITDNPITTTSAPLATIISPLTSSSQNQSTNHSCLSNIPAVIERSDKARKSVASISQMNYMLQQSQSSFCSMVCWGFSSVLSME